VAGSSEDFGGFGLGEQVTVGAEGAISGKGLTPRKGKR
jgi:hypothetical protein